MTQDRTRMLFVDGAVPYRKIVRDILAKAPGVGAVAVAADASDGLKPAAQAVANVLQ